MSVRLAVLKSQQARSKTGKSVAYGLVEDPKTLPPSMAQSKTIEAGSVDVPINQRDWIHQNMREAHGFMRASEQGHPMRPDEVQYVKY